MIPRFLVVVLSVYRQIRNQGLNILADLDEDNFDRAFDILRPGKEIAVKGQPCCSACADDDVHSYPGNG